MFKAEREPEQMLLFPHLPRHEEVQRVTDCEDCSLRESACGRPAPVGVPRDCPLRRAPILVCLSRG